MKRSTARISVAAFLAAATLLTGCNSDDSGSGGSAGKQTSDATSAGTDAGTTDATGSSDDTGSTDEELDKASFYKAVIDAQVEAGSYRSRSSSTTAGMSAVMEGEATYRDGKLFGHVKSSADSPQQIEGVVAAGVLYLKGTSLGLPSGKWLKLDPNDPDNADSPLAALAAVADPEAALRAMGDLTALSKVGEESIEGVATTHYKATMSTKNYADVLGLPAEAAKLMPATMPFDMWIDEENRPVKMTLEFDIAGQKSSTEQTYFDYGADIDVTVPEDADTVTPKQAGLGGLGG